MRLWRVLCLVCVAFASSSCVRDDPPPFRGTVFNPAYYGGEGAGAAPQCAALSGVQVIETRPEPMVVGHRIHEERPAQRYPITASSEPAKWVHGALVESFRKSVLSTRTAGRGAMVVSIAALDLDEKTSFNSTYNAQLVLDVTVTKPGANETCWTGRVEGQANNYGEAAKQENYIETLNHALDRATVSLMSEQGFLDAACGKCAAGSAHSL